MACSPYTKLYVLTPLFGSELMMYCALRPVTGELGSALPFTPKKVQ
jgi:hypothetical protein